MAILASGGHELDSPDRGGTDPARAGSRPPARIADYQLLRYIGQGSMASVYLAEDQRRDRQVALKLLAAELAHDDAFRAGMFHDTKTAAAIGHPSILPVYEAGQADGTLFAAMRYVRGGDARSLLNRLGPLPLGYAWLVIAQIASALDAAHAHGLIHRDVRPANILLEADVPAAAGAAGLGSDVESGHAYLADFGMSRAFSPDQAIATGQLAGTLDYVAPEQIEGVDLDGRTDLYSLACTGFELLCGTPPFGQDQGLTLMYAQLYAPAPAVTARRDLPEAVDIVLATALAKRPADRYPNCTAFADELRTALGLGSVDLTEPPAARTAGPPAPRPPSLRPPSPPGPPVGARLAAVSLATADEPTVEQPAVPDRPSQAPSGAAAAVTSPRGEAAVTSPRGEEAPAVGTVPAGAPAGAARTVSSPAAPSPPGEQSRPDVQPPAWAPATMPAVGPDPLGLFAPVPGVSEDDQADTAADASPGGTAGATAAGDDQDTHLGGWPDQRRRRRKPLLAGAAVVVVVAAVAIGVALSQHPAHHPAASPAPVTPSPAATSASAPASPSASPSASTSTPAAVLASQQASALGTLLASSGAARTTLTSAVNQVVVCSNLSGAVGQLQHVVDQRSSEYGRASALKTSALPQGAQVKSDLMSALRNSLTADKDFLSWAQQQQAGGCTPSGQSSAYNAAYGASQQADSAKESFVQAWNPVAAKYGLRSSSAESI